jgi:heme/copper-type cytochrome/quinol oxidase subunit 2
LLLLVVVLFSVLYLFQINRMTYALCMQKDIPEEKQTKIFSTINILITILLISFYIEVYFAIKF